MSAASELVGMTDETFAMVKALTSGLTYATGLDGVDLQKYVSLVPVDTPWRNSTPRVGAPQGAKFAYWRTLTNVNNLQSNGAIPADTAGPVVQVNEQDVFAPFAKIAQGFTVTQDAIDAAEGYADALAVGTIQTLNQEMITDDINQLNAQAFAVPALTAPTLTAASTGGSIAGGTAVHVSVAARSGENYYYGGSGPASASTTATVGTLTNTYSVTAFVPAVKTAAAWDWFVGTSDGNEVYYTTTTVNTVTITAVHTAAQEVPSLPLISAVQPTTPPTADTSFQTYWMNGLVATILGDWGANNYVTPGSGTAQGAVWTSLDGAQFQVSGAAIEQLDQLNLDVYNKYQVSPTRYLMSSQTINDLANAILGNNQAMTWLVPTDADGRAKIVAGGAVAQYLNKTKGGYPIVLELQPHLPPGRLVAVVDKFSYPGSNIDSPVSLETQRDYTRFDYGANRGQPGVVGGGPRYDFEIDLRAAFRNTLGPVMGVLDNIGAGVAS